MGISARFGYYSAGFAINRLLTLNLQKWNMKSVKSTKRLKVKVNPQCIPHCYVADKSGWWERIVGYYHPQNAELKTIA